ncbi:hypothetical protein [Streptomyces sp. NPDC003077]|uniref:hypothetical protein n=1 Tax=Streptomyces sp. NPDC003077 TaxID=3154443 RepID=UPI0033A88457
MGHAWSSLPTPVVSAVISAAVALVVAVVAPSLKYGFDKRFHRRKLDIEYTYEQQKELRNRIALYKGLLLETGGALRNRLWNFLKHEGHGWLRMRGSCAESGYYLRSFAYRILCLVAACRLIERQALYVDSVVAAPSDRRFLEAMKLNIAVWTRADLYAGLPYDGGRNDDHFFRDQLTDMADTLYQDGRLLSFTEFSRRLAENDDEYRTVFVFLNGAGRQERNRFRFDRLIAVQLVLLATLNRFGYAYQQVSFDRFGAVARACEHPVVLANLCAMTRELGLDEEKGFRQMLTAATATATTTGH